MSRTVPASMADKLLATAGELAPSWDDVRTDDIAEASGIPRATLYYYFSSKDEILQFLLTRMLQRLTEAVVAAESQCCAFLTMRVTDEPGAVVLIISAPERAEAVLAELVDAFRGQPQVA